MLISNFNFILIRSSGVRRRWLFHTSLTKLRFHVQRICTENTNSRPSSLLVNLEASWPFTSFLVMTTTFSRTRVPRVLATHPSSSFSARLRHMVRHSPLPTAHCPLGPHVTEIRIYVSVPPRLNQLHQCQGSGTERLPGPRINPDSSLPLSPPFLWHQPNFPSFCSASVYPHPFLQLQSLFFYSSPRLQSCLAELRDKSGIT
jgi:hypothetical protein